MIRIYADESFYKDQYLCGREPVISAGFSFFARSASQVIDRITFDRAKGLVELPEEVKMCCCEMAEHLYLQNLTVQDAAGKTSEKIGSYSVTYASGYDADSAEFLAQHAIVLKWLESSGLCYRGC